MAIAIVPIPYTRQNNTLPIMSRRTAHAHTVRNSNTLGVAVRARRCTAQTTGRSEDARRIRQLAKR